MTRFFGTLFIALFVTLSIHFVTVSAKSCSKAEDCQKTECCLDKGLFSDGECKALAKENEACHEQDDKAYFISGKYKDNCPCQKSFICEPTKVESWFVFGTKKLNERCIPDEKTKTTAAPAVETTKAP